MKKTITLALNIKTKKSKIHVSFYCAIPEVKEGFMFLALENTSQENAFWYSLHKVISCFKAKYKSYSLDFAFSELLFDLPSVSHKEKTITLIKKFNGFNFIDDSNYRHDLQLMDKLSVKLCNDIDVLFGLSKEEFSALINPKKSDTITKKSYQYYDDFFVPTRGVVLDFESTSHLTEYARIIEISALKFHDGKIIDRFNTLVNPGVKIPKKIRELTGITQEEIDRAPSSFAAIKQLLFFLRGYKVIVGHNVFYDFSLLDNFCSRFNIPEWKGQLLCTRRLAQNTQLKVPNYKLETLCEVFNIINSQPHRAWSDTEATFELMNSLYNDNMII